MYQTRKKITITISNTENREPVISHCYYMPSIELNGETENIIATIYGN